MRTTPTPAPLPFAATNLHLAQQKNTDPFRLNLGADTSVGKQVRYIIKEERLKWSEGIDNATFKKTRIRLLDIAYRKNNEILVRQHDPRDSFFSRTPNGKYWTVASLRGKSKTDGPIILDFNHTIIDGHHRLIDAAWNEEDFIDAYVRVRPPKTSRRKR